MQQAVVEQFAAAGENLAGRLGRQRHHQRLVGGISASAAQHRRGRPAQFQTPRQQRLAPFLRQRLQALQPGSQAARVEQVQAGLHVLVQAFQQGSDADPPKAHPRAFVDMGDGVATVEFLLPAGIQDGPRHRRERHRVVRQQQREAQPLGGLAQCLDVRRRLHVLADHQAGHLGLGQALHVQALRIGFGRNADARGHQQVALAQPFGGIGQFAHVGPAQAPRQARGAAEQAGAQGGAFDDVVDAEGHGRVRRAERVLRTRMTSNTPPCRAGTQALVREYERPAAILGSV
ncbi:hypothetical protein D9M71_207220 [compost metagenome]